MKSFEKWLWAVSLFPIFVLFGADLKFSSEITQLYLSLTLIYPFFLSKIYNSTSFQIKNHILVVIFSIILIFFNIILSLDTYKSFVYWLIYLFFVYGIYGWFLLMKKKGEIPSFIYFLKTSLDKYLILSVFIIYLALTYFKFGELKTYNSFGIITGSTIVYVWFKRYKKTFSKPIILSVLIFFLLTSFSRSSFIFVVLTILVTEIIIVKKNGIRKLTTFIGFFAIVFLYSNQLLSWFSEKEIGNNINITQYSNLIQLNEDRSILIDMFWEVFSNNFFTGYGIDVPYYQLDEWNKVDNIGVHNGVLDMVLLIGVPLSLIIIYYFIVSFKKIIKNNIKDKSYTPILAFVIYCLFRCYGESYFLLNIGNLMSILLLIIIIFFYSLNIRGERRNR